MWPHIYTGLFVYGLVQNYQEQRADRYLSLDSGDGICEDITKDVSGVYYADVDGNWVGSEDFEYSKAIYVFQFFQLRTSESEFYKAIDSFLNELEPANLLMKQRNLAYTVVYWTAWMFSSRNFLDGDGVNDEYDDDIDKVNVFSEDYNSHYFGLSGNVCKIY